MRVIVTKTKIGEVKSNLPVIHAPVVKVEAVDNKQAVDSEWVVYTSTNAIENLKKIPDTNIACMPSCVPILDSKGITPHLVFKNLESNYVLETINSLLKETTVTYLSGDKTSLDLDRISNRQNFKRIVVYQTIVNEKQDFFPVEGDYIIFWSGFAVQAAEQLDWGLENCKIFTCSESASKALKLEHTKLSTFRTEDVLTEIAGFLRV